MSKKSDKENGKKDLTDLNPWEQAISDAEKLIQHYKGKIQKLRGAIVGFRDMRDQGVPWPGASEATFPFVAPTAAPSAQQCHVFNPICNDADECECGLVRSAEVHQESAVSPARQS